MDQLQPVDHHCVVALLPLSPSRYENLSYFCDKMSFHKISFDVNETLNEVSFFRKNRNDGAGGAVMLLARIWFLKSEIFVKRSTTLLTLSLEDFIADLSEGSKFLMKCLSPCPVLPAPEEMLDAIEQLPRMVESLYQTSSKDEELAGMKVKDFLYKFLVQAMFFKAESLLLGLLKDEGSFAAPLKNQIGDLQESLSFLRKSEINIMSRENSEAEKVVLTEFEAAAAAVISLFESEKAGPNSTLTSKDMECQISDLLLQVGALQAKVKSAHVHNPGLSTPKTPGLSFIQLLLRKLSDLPTQKQVSVKSVARKIEAIRKDMESIISAGGHWLFDEGLENQEWIQIQTLMVDAAYQLEYLIDSMMVDNDSGWQKLLWLYHLSEDIARMKSQVAKIHKDIVHISPGEMVSAPAISAKVVDEAVVGFSDRKKATIDKLIGGMSGRNIASIVGVPGVGKSTLAKHVCSDLQVRSHFSVFAWCCVSRTYRKRDVLLEILRQITELKDDMLESSDDDLELLLYQRLKRRRYLIVMDDMWTTQVWDELHKSFPDDRNASRVLMTSRFHNVVQVFGEPYHLLQLSPPESWELLQKKIFGGTEKCPERLSEVGQRIATSCKGLPLAIGLVAGLLIGRKESMDWWEKIADNVSSELQRMDIFELNYRYMPDYLKACFLYFAALPRVEKIAVKRLMFLWIAEGFVHKDESRSKSLEGIAEEYLMELISRGMVIAAEVRSSGGVKACQVHDLALEFCFSKAKDARFLEQITCEDHEPGFDGLEQHRLLVCGDQEQFITAKPSGQYLRSLLFSPNAEMYAECDDDVSFIFRNFKLLRVLDLETINVGDSLEDGIGLLVCLKYLAVGGDMDSLPSSFASLRDLEILVVKGLMNKFAIPEWLWSMTKLRHLHVTNHSGFNIQIDHSNSLPLESLVTLSFPSFSYGEETQNIIARCPNLQKLSCKVLQGRDAFNIRRLPEFESLEHLESLKVLYQGRPLQTDQFRLPSNIKKLTLSNFRLPWSHISNIGRLPNLEVLKLSSKAFDGAKWEMAEDEFKSLRYLKLDSLNIVHWIANEDHLPCLEQLMVRNCNHLVEVPLDFANIDTLQKIEVQLCAESARESVKELLNRRLELTGEKIDGSF